MIRRPPRSTLSSSSAASDVYKRQVHIRSSGSVKAKLSGNLIPVDTSVNIECSYPTYRLVSVPAQNITATFTDLEFADTAGGAMWIKTIAENALTFDRVRFTNNGVLGHTHGGAVCVSLGLDLVLNPDGTRQGLFKVLNSSFVGNSGFTGGAMSIQLLRDFANDTVSFQDTLFESNTASSSGGAVQLRGRLFAPSFVRCQFLSNIAANGGGLFVEIETLVVVRISNSLFEGNRATLGAGLYTSSLCTDVESCPTEIVEVTDTEFSNNRAYGGAGVYIFSAGNHRFERCVFQYNAGLQTDIAGLKIQSFGAGLYSGSLSTNVQLSACHFLHNSADATTAVGLRPFTFFPGVLLLENCIIANNSANSEVMQIEFVPFMNITVVNSTVSGTLLLKTAAQMTIHSSEVSTVVVQDGGTAYLHSCDATGGIQLGFSASCGESQGQITTTTGGTSVCKAHSALTGFSDLGIRDLRTNYSIFVSDTDGNPVVVDSWNVTMIAIGAVRPSTGGNLNSFSTVVDLENSVDTQLTNQLVVPPESDTLVCSGQSVDLICKNHHGGIPKYAVGIIAAVGALIVIAMIARGVFLYREWSLPGYGLVGAPSCCTCYHCLACTCIKSHDVEDGELLRTETPDTSLDNELRDTCTTLEMNPASYMDPNEDEDLSPRSETSVVACVLGFGYGLIDYQSDLCLKETIGQGNFGSVRKAVLRRRGKHAARLVAVKELTQGCSADLLAEAKLMQDTPPHPNVVFFFGVTELPYCLISQLIEDACEFNEHIIFLQSSFTGPERLEATLQLLLDASHGIAHLHEHGIVHCDIAPRNILVANSRCVNPRPRAMVNDFGLARRVAEGEKHMFSGKYRRYLASPENYEFDGSHGRPGDVFMLACTMWQVIGLHWDLFKTFFEEGKGLKSRNLRQDTMPARHGSEPKRGVMVLYEAICDSFHGIVASRLPHVHHLAEGVCQLVCDCLLHDDAARPTMPEMRSRLWALWNEIREVDVVRGSPRSTKIAGGPLGQELEETLPEMQADACVAVNI
eukprot:TRINITY_DN49610_c0_g1_i3.p1 TRINITY_DN49610_c0_g1~~TRINITY_DN49610_c0_g1_i3.p1  ORF type:complete len:1026 (-),score=139.17 TRINITY_DN49610_c0_g1_i3:64-3141(-)